MRQQRPRGVASSRRRARPCCVNAAAANDCGPAALATICRAFGVPVALEEVRRLAGTDLQGTNLDDLRRAAEVMGFSASSGRASVGLSELPLPAVLHLTGEPADHFVVLFSVRGGRALIGDPSIGLIRLSLDDLAARWTGATVLLRPGPGFPAFTPGRPRRSGLLWRALRQEWRCLAACVAMSLVAWGAAVALARVSGAIVDLLAPVGHRHGWDALALAGTAAVAGAVAFTLLKNLQLAFLSWRVVAGLGRRFAVHVMALPARAFDRISAGDVTARLFDINSVGHAVATAAFNGVVEIVALLVTGAVLLTLDPTLAAIALAAALPVAAAGLAGVRVFERQEREIRVLTSQMTAALMDLLLNIKVVKMYAFEGGAARHFAELHSRATAAARGQAVCRGWLSGVGSLAGAGATLAVVLAGASLAATGRGTLGQLVFFLGITGLFVGAAGQLVPSLLLLRQAQVGVDRLEDLFGREAEPTAAPKDGNEIREGHLRLHNVGFEYRRGTRVLSGINLDLAPGETVCILGETGCGKTTLASILAGLYEPTAGAAVLDAAASDSCCGRGLRGHVLVVFQEHGLLQGTIRDNILLGWPAGEAEVIEAARLACADRFVRKLPGRYGYLVGPGGGLLSSGQRQRITLARALLRHPPVLILDEATSNLDSQTELEVLLNLRSSRERQATVFITHRLTTAMRADRVIVLAGGSIVEEGRHGDLLARPGAYQRLWAATGLAASQALAGAQP